MGLSPRRCYFRTFKHVHVIELLKFRILWTLYTTELVNNFQKYNVSMNNYSNNLYGCWCTCNVCSANTVKSFIVDPCSGNTCEHICVLTHVRENHGLGYKCICAIGYELSDNGVNCTSKNKKCRKTDILTEKRQTFKDNKCLSTWRLINTFL